MGELGPAVSSVTGKAHKPGSGPCKFCLALEKLLPATTLLTTLSGLVPPFAQASPSRLHWGGEFVLTQRLSPGQRCSSGRMQVVGVGVCSARRALGDTNQGGFLLPRSGPSAGPFPVLASDKMCSSRSERVGWGHVLCTVSEWERWASPTSAHEEPASREVGGTAAPGVLSSSEEELCLVQNYFLHQILIEVICWSTPAANLSLGLLFCSCLNHTLMNDQCEMGYEEKK